MLARDLVNRLSTCQRLRPACVWSITAMLHRICSQPVGLAPTGIVYSTRGFGPGPGNVFSALNQSISTRTLPVVQHMLQMLRQQPVSVQLDRHKIHPHRLQE